MSAILATAQNRLVLGAAGLVSALIGWLGLPDLGWIWDLLRRIQEILALGGMALALGVSLLFILAWVISHVRKPKKFKEGEGTGKRIISKLALWSSYVPVGLTVVAAVGLFVPTLAPFMLKAFAFAVLGAAISWSLAVAAIVVGGEVDELKRARRALLLAGTPWYCLAIWVSRFL